MSRQSVTHSSFIAMLLKTLKDKLVPLFPVLQKNMGDAKAP
jgi:hypothetical protein